MERATSVEAQEQQAYLALNHIRDARDTLPEGHPAAPLLDEAVAVAEAHWRDLRATAEASRGIGTAQRRPRET